MNGWTAITGEEEVPCAGCGGTCGAPADSPPQDSSLGARSVIFGSIGFFLGPIVLAIAAAALFDDGALVQVIAAGGALLIGMAVARIVGRAFGFSRERPP